MTNREWLNTLSDERLWVQMKWIVTRKSLESTNADNYIPKWLGEEHKKSEQDSSCSLGLSPQTAATSQTIIHKPTYLKSQQKRNEMTHHLIISECFAAPVLNGDKSFEVRYGNDRGFQKGDKVQFTVVDDIGIAMTHPLNEVTFVITYVLSGCGLKKDYVVFGIKKFKGETE